MLVYGGSTRPYIEGLKSGISSYKGIRLQAVYHSGSFRRGAKIDVTPIHQR